MKFILSIVCLLLGQTIFSQTKPAFFPEDISTNGDNIQCYCKPGTRNKSRSKGIKFSYSFLGNGTFKDEDGSIMAPFSEYKRWQSLKFGIKIPIVNKEKLKILLGYKHYAESFSINFLGADFSETFQELGATDLTQTSVGLIVTKPLNETKYLAFRFRYSANGNYSNKFLNVERDYSVYKALVLLGIKRSEDFEWGIGINVSNSFRGTSILPFLLYNRNFGKHWGIESIFPANIYGRYNLKPTTILLFGAEYSSNSYRMKVNTLNNETLDYGLNHSEIIGMLRLEQQITPWVWTNLKVGYQTNFSTDFESKSATTTSFQVEPSSRLFLQVGLFISPPDKFFKS